MYATSRQFLCFASISSTLLQNRHYCVFPSFPCSSFLFLFILALTSLFVVAHSMQMTLSCICSMYSSISCTSKSFVICLLLTLPLLVIPFTSLTFHVCIMYSTFWVLVIINVSHQYVNTGLNIVF